MADVLPRDALSPAEEEAFAALLEIWRGVLSEIGLSYPVEAAASAMMLVAMQAQEESAGSEYLADTLEGLAATVRSKRPAGGGSAATH